MAGSIYGTLEGSNIEIGCDGESLTVNGIKMVLKKDIVTTNGVIHLIDQVLMPDSGETLYMPTGFNLTLFDLKGIKYTTFSIRSYEQCVSFVCLSAKQVMELVGKSQSMFGDLVSELGLSAAMQPETEYTLLAPLNGAFSGEMAS